MHFFWAILDFLGAFGGLLLQGDQNFFPLVRGKTRGIENLILRGRPREIDMLGTLLE
jgi:hypothetical protein